MLFEEALRDQNLTATEMAVVSYITAHPHEASHMAVRELAEAAFTSPAAVIRLCKKLGFASFGDMKIELARELASSDAFADVDADYPELSRASRDQVTSTIASMEGSAIKKTEKLLAQVKWDPILRAMRAATGISIYGLGFSAMAATGFGENMRRLGVNVTQVVDTPLAWHWASACPRTELSVFVSYTGEPSYLLTSARTLFHRGCNIIAVTAEGTSELARLATWKLPIALTERRFANNRMGPFQSATEERFALDVLYAQYFAYDYAGNVKRLNDALARQGAYVEQDRAGNVNLHLPSA